MSGVQIGSLHVSLSADSAVFEKGMEDAASTSESTFAKIKDGAALVAGALVAAFTVDYITGAIKQQIDYADSLADVAARSFQTTEQLSAMQYALSFSDATLEDYTAGLQKLSVNMQAVTDGNKEQAELFQRVGVEVTDQNGRLRDAGEVLLDFSDKLAVMEDGADKTALVMDVLGKSAGPQLMPFLNQGRDAISELTGEASRFGLVVSGDVSNQAGQLNDNIDRMKFAAQGAWQTLSNAMLPSLVSVSTQMTATASNTNMMKAAGEGLGVAFKVVYTGAASTFLALEKVGDKLGKLAAVGAAVASGDLESARSIWNDTRAEDQYQAKLFAIGDMWRQVGDQASASAVVQEQAATTATTLLPSPQVKSGLKPSGKKSDPEKTQQAGIDAAFEEYSRRLDAERAFQDELAAIKKRDEDTVAQEEADRVAGIDAAFEEYSQKLDAERAYQDEVAALRRKSLDDEINNRRLATDFITASFSNLGQKHKAFAKAGEALNKAMALKQIYTDTPVAAMAAAKAVAGIPVIGPKLAPIAYGAMKALGLASAAGVLSGGGVSAPAGGDVGAMTATTTVQPQSEQRAEEQAKGGVTYVSIPEDAILTGRRLLDLLDAAVGDGKQPTNFRFVPS